MRCYLRHKRALAGWRGWLRRAGSCQSLSAFLSVVVCQPWAFSYTPTAVPHSLSPLAFFFLAPVLLLWVTSGLLRVLPRVARPFLLPFAWCFFVHFLTPVLLLEGHVYAPRCCCCCSVHVPVLGRFAYLLRSIAHSFTLSLTRSRTKSLMKLTCTLLCLYPPCRRRSLPPALFSLLACRTLCVSASHRTNLLHRPPPPASRPFSTRYRATRSTGGAAFPAVAAGRGPATRKPSARLAWRCPPAAAGTGAGAAEATAATR